MKILSIAGRNLNSLRADFKVDFTCGALKDCGIFAITGPTGAGKTTLLDAITLALYGKTPRSATDEDIISYGSGDAWAEVIFQTSEGIFKSEWKVRRARNKYDGALQQSTMEVSNYANGKILSQGKREALDKIKLLIKLEYDQFLKSVLLAQGAFKAFLDAREGERGEMLEKISDTSLYTMLSKKAFERKRKEERALEMLQAALGNVSLLSEEERLAYEKIITGLKESERNLQHKFTDLRIKSNWLQSIEELTKKFEDAGKEVVLSRQNMETEQPNLQRWESHLQVASFEVEWAQYLSKLQECASQRQNIEKLEAKLTQLAERLELAKTVLTNAQALADQALKLREEKMPGILQAITRQGDVHSLKKEVDEILDKHKAKILEETGCRTKIRVNETILTRDKKKLEELGVWFAQYHYYKEANTSFNQAGLLVNELKRSKSDIELNETTLLRREQQIVLAKKEIKQSQINEANAINELQKSQDVKVNTSKLIGQLKSQLIIHLREIINYQENILLEMEEKQNLLSRQEFLADHLSRLHEGEACPLCGSTDHPNQRLSAAELKVTISEIRAGLKRNQGIFQVNGLQQKALEKMVGNLDDFNESAYVNKEIIPQNFETVFNELIQLWKFLPQKQYDISQQLASSKQMQLSLAANISQFEAGKIEANEKLLETRENMARQVNELEKIAILYRLQFDPVTPDNLPKLLKKYSAEFNEKTREDDILKGTIPGTEAAIEALKDQVHGLGVDLNLLQKDIDLKIAIIKRYSDEIEKALTGYSSAESARKKLNEEEKAANDRARQASEQLNVILQETGEMLGEKTNAANACKELEHSIDLLKNPFVILDAYNDKAGITKQFNLNLLQRINRELEADFNTMSFDHYPVYDPQTGACKSYLVSLRDQVVRLGEADFIFFKEGEPVLTEISQKYGIEQVENMAVDCGYTLLDNLYDSRKWFTDSLWIYQV